MELQDISLGKTSYNLENPLENSEEFIGIGKEKVDSLKNSIAEIGDAIQEREALSKVISEEVDKIKMTIENFLMQTQAVDAEDFKERTGLRQKQIEISELQLNEKINCWRDVALLKKELRELKKELTEKESRLAMFGKILDDADGGEK